jgi:hypothetical protein
MVVGVAAVTVLKMTQPVPSPAHLNHWYWYFVGELLKPLAVAVSTPLGAVLPVIAALPPVGSPLTAPEVVAFAGMLEPAAFDAVTVIWMTALSSAATSL